MSVDLSKFQQEHMVRQFIGAVLLAHPEVRDTVKTAIFDVQLSVNGVAITELARVISLLVKDAGDPLRMGNRFPLLAIVLGNKRKGVGGFVTTETAAWAKVVDERVTSTWSLTSAREAGGFVGEVLPRLSRAAQLLESAPAEVAEQLVTARALLQSARSRLPT